MRLLVVDDDAALRKRLKKGLEQHGHRVELARDGVEAWHHIRRDEVDAVVTDLVMPHMDGLELARTVRRNPVTRELLMVMVSDDDPLRLLTCRDVVDEVLPKPVDVDVLEARLRDLWERSRTHRLEHHSPTTESRVVAVTGAKGGAGVSTVTANLALALAMTNDLSTVAVDLDLEYGDLPMLLDVTPPSGLDALIRSLSVDGDQVAPEDHLARHRTGLRVLASPPSPVDAVHVDEAGVNHLILRLRALHDLLVVDIPPGFGDPALAVLLAATRVVIVVSPEMTALRRTRTLLEVLADLEVPQNRLLLVYNHIIASAPVTRERAEQTLGLRFAVEIPHETALFRAAATEGTPAVLLDPVGEVARRFIRLSERVLLPA